MKFEKNMEVRNSAVPSQYHYEGNNGPIMVQESRVQALVLEAKIGHVFSACSDLDLSGN